MNFAILGLGSIACKMAETVSKMDDVKCYCVASRSINKAQDFAKKWNFEKAYTYEEIFNDDKIDLIYIATPHSLHYQYAKMALENKKNVLLEKAFTVNSKEAKELINLAKKNNVLLAEAIWTRYMPSCKMIDELLPSIGNIESLTANLGYSLTHIERLTKKEYAGGALLDLGVYTINFALMVMKEKITKIETSSLMKDGVDLMNSITLFFQNKMAVLHSTMLSNTNRLGVIYGSNGYIEVVNINNCEEIRVYTDGLCKTYNVPKQITGYEYEVEACQKAIKEGKIECEEMNHESILYVMEIMDEIRKKWHMELPNDNI